jgi:hypothetical protein
MKRIFIYTLSLLIGVGVMLTSFSLKAYAIGTYTDVCSWWRDLDNDGVQDVNT